MPKKKTLPTTLSESEQAYSDWMDDEIHALMETPEEDDETEETDGEP